MQATLLVACACGKGLGRVAMDTADLGIPGDWVWVGNRVQQFLDVHRRGFCAVYNPAGAVAPKVHLRTPRFRPGHSERR